MTPLGQARERPARAPRSAYATLGPLFAAVGLVLAASTTVTVLLHVWTTRTPAAATAWLSGTPGAQVIDVQAHSRTLYIAVRTPADLPPLDRLLADLGGKAPDGVPVAVVTTQGRQLQVGRVGD
jgi:hypothetical protein